MGTYTTNYQLYTPTVGETGWGTLVNGNFTTIDTTMKGLSNRITAVENEVNGNLSCTSVTTSGKITGNGGIAGTTGTFSGAVTGSSFNSVPIKSSGVYTVTPTTSRFMPRQYMMILPFKGGKVTYSGSLTVHNTSSTTAGNFQYFAGGSNLVGISVPINESATVTFTNIPFMQYTSIFVTFEVTGYTLS